MEGLTKLVEKTCLKLLEKKRNKEITTDQTEQTKPQGIEK
jgi:hypothetical protein